MTSSGRLLPFKRAITLLEADFRTVFRKLTAVVTDNGTARKPRLLALSCKSSGWPANWNSLLAVGLLIHPSRALVLSSPVLSGRFSCGPLQPARTTFHP